MTCGTKRRTQKLGHHILRYVSNVHVVNAMINLLLAKKHRENNLKRPIPASFVLQSFTETLRYICNLVYNVHVYILLVIEYGMLIILSAFTIYSVFKLALLTTVSLAYVRE